MTPALACCSTLGRPARSVRRGRYDSKPERSRRALGGGSRQALYVTPLHYIEGMSDQESEPSSPALTALARAPPMTSTVLLRMPTTGMSSERARASAKADVHARGSVTRMAYAPRPSRLRSSLDELELWAARE